MTMNVIEARIYFFIHIVVTSKHITWKNMYKKIWYQNIEFSLITPVIYNIETYNSFCTKISN